MAELEDELGELPAVGESWLGQVTPHAGDEVAELAVEAERHPLLRRAPWRPVVIVLVAVPQFMIGGPLHSTLGVAIVALGAGSLVSELVTRLRLRRAARANWPDRPSLWYGPWDADGRARPVHVRRVRAGWTQLLPPLVAGLAVFGLMRLDLGGREFLATVVAACALAWAWSWWASQPARSLRLVTSPLPARPGARVRWSLEAVDGAPLIELEDVRLRVLERTMDPKPRARVTAARALRSPLPESIAGDEVIELEIDLPDDQPGSRFSLVSARWWELVVTGSHAGRRVQWYFLLPVFPPQECVTDQAPGQAARNR